MARWGCSPRRGMLETAETGILASCSGASLLTSRMSRKKKEQQIEQDDEILIPEKLYFRIGRLPACAGCRLTCSFLGN